MDRSARRARVARAFDKSQEKELVARPPNRNRSVRRRLVFRVRERQRHPAAKSLGQASPPAHEFHLSIEPGPTGIHSTHSY